MMTKRHQFFAAILSGMIAIASFSLPLEPAQAKLGLPWRQWDSVSYLRGPYNLAFFYRHNKQYRHSAGIHFGHGKAHDVLQLTDLKDRAKWDQKFEQEAIHMTFEDQPWTEPSMFLYGPWTGQVVWDLYRAIDWTHMHHEQTYDVMSDKDIPWDKKDQWTRRSVEYYLEKLDIPRSPAPLDVTMRRAGTMMKPYFTYFRNYYPQSNNYFYYAHWWHPVIYEAQMLGGNGSMQDTLVERTHQTGRQVIQDRPLRMLLSREAMPRYSRLSPESGNIFDNLHMLHGIAYDILAYPHWSREEKEKELNRVIRAMSYQPGDEKLARKFTIPHPDMKPWVYYDWMKPVEGSMTNIMEEMMMEMMPVMMPDGQQMTPEMHAKMMDQFKKKMTPGIQEGEIEGSLHDAMKALMPNMKMDPDSMKAGVVPQKMIDAMLAGWQQKYGNMPDVEPMPMNQEPALSGLDENKFENYQNPQVETELETKPNEVK